MPIAYGPSGVETDPVDILLRFTHRLSCRVERFGRPYRQFALLDTNSQMFDTRPLTRPLGTLRFVFFVVLVYRARVYNTHITQYFSARSEATTQCDFDLLTLVHFRFCSHTYPEVLKNSSYEYNWEWHFRHRLTRCS